LSAKGDGLLVGAFRRAVRGGLRAGLRLSGRYVVTGRDHVPASGAFLVAANHTSFLDPVVVGCAMRPWLGYMARSSLFEVPGFGALIRSFKAFPVERGTSDRRALRQTVEVLRSGTPVVVFPEGTRGDGREVAAFQRGFVLIAELADVPVLPAGIWGTHRVWPKGQRWPRPGPIGVAFGPAIDARTAVARGAGFIRDQVCEMVVRARRGVGPE
jgi:1-acyl-sn-glycerol-3-phosphate acyltransferase